MAIDTSGMITVAEAARRLHRSQEQVRRNLRDGKLRGQRIGNQWFVEEVEEGEALAGAIPKPLISPEQMARIRALRAQIAPKLRHIDLVEYLRKHRNED